MDRKNVQQEWQVGHTRGTSNPFLVYSFFVISRQSVTAMYPEGIDMWKIFQDVLRKLAKATLAHHVRVTEKDDTKQEGKLTTYCQVGKLSVKQEMDAAFLEVKYCREMQFR